MKAKAFLTAHAQRRRSRGRVDASPLMGSKAPERDAAAHPGLQLQPLVFSDGALAAVKWLAAVLMLLDHTNKYLYGGTIGWMYAAGRLSMPLFAFVLGMNLSRPEMLLRGGYRRLSVRLLVFGTLATAPFVAVNHLTAGWWPLNMMFSFLVATVAAWMFDRSGSMSKILGWLVVAWGGALVEFWWPAVGLCLCVWAYQRRPSRSLVIGYLFCLVALWLVNGNFWAMAVLSVLFALQRWWSQPLPRARWFFYAFYPLHLVVFWLLA